MAKKAGAKTIEQRKAALQSRLKALEIQEQIKSLRDAQKKLRKG